MTTPAVLELSQLRAGSRRRWWLVLAAVVALVGVYVTWWVGYATIHFEDRFHQLSPGAAATVHGTTVIVQSITTSRLLEPTGSAAGGDPAAADAGAVWVVARLQLIGHDPAGSLVCAFTLVGTTGRSWDNVSFAPVSRAHDTCPSDAPIDTPEVVEQLFMVPEADSARLAGIAVDDASSPDRMPVLSPPA